LDERIALFSTTHPDIPAGTGCINSRDHDPFRLHDLAMVITNALAPSAVILKREQRARSSSKYNLL
jgi:hypothetical protein